MEIWTDPNVWISFLTLCALEIVLGIDNIVFISILTNRLPVKDQKPALRLGLVFAMVMRIGLLFSISWVMGLTEPLFQILGQLISGRDLILILGGLFLLYKSINEIHNKFEDEAEAEKVGGKKKTNFVSVIGQILLIDLVFSLDSVITAVGMVDHISIMVAAVIVSVSVMLVSASTIANFVNRHPAVKVLALAFLIMIGTALIAEGLDFHFPKGYIYFAMAFSVAVEFINIRLGARGKSV